MTDLSLIASLSDNEKKAILFCERDGNGAHFYQIHSLVKKGLMSLKPIPELKMIEAYRLNDLGITIRDWLRKNT